MKDSTGSGPAAFSLCGGVPVQTPRSAGMRKCTILLLQIKKKKTPVLIATNLDSSTNFKEALERLLDYTEKGKMLKERVLMQS